MERNKKGKEKRVKSIVSSDKCKINRRRGGWGKKNSQNQHVLPSAIIGLFLKFFNKDLQYNIVWVFIVLM